MGAFHLISGNDEFAVKECANEFIRGLCGEIPEDNPDLEIIRGDSENEKYSEILDKLMDSLNTPSFLSPEKTVWLKHFNYFEEAVSEASSKKKTSRLERLSEYLKAGIPPDITLLIDGPGLDRRKAFFRLCEKTIASSGGTLQWFDKADPKARGYTALLMRKIREMAMSAGKSMDDAAASFIAETIGSDTATLKNEIDKLVAYAGNEPVIHVDDCLEVCSRNVETLSWEFSGALAERNAAKALSLIPGLIETLEERGSASGPLAIVSAVNSEFKRVIGLKCIGRRFQIPRNASADFFYRLFDTEKANHPGDPFFAMHPFKAFKTWENAVRFSDRELAEAFRAIFEASRIMVTGGDQRIALENLVIKIGGAAS